MSTELKKLYLLMDLADIAPDAPLKKSIGFVSAYHQALKESFDQKMVIAVLADMLGIANYSKISHEREEPRKLIIKHKDDKAILYALHSALHSHSWVVCSPTFTDKTSMEETKERLAKKYKGTFDYIIKEAPND